MKAGRFWKTTDTWKEGKALAEFPASVILSLAIVGATLTAKILIERLQSFWPEELEEFGEREEEILERRQLE